MNLDSIISKTGLSWNLTQDVTFLIIIIAASFVFGLFIGRYKLITILINIYVSLALLAAVPEKYLTGYNYELIFFLALVVILTLFGRQLFEIHISGSGKGFMWRVFVMSFLEIILLASIIFSILPKDKALNFVSANVYHYLASSDWRFIWMAVPLVFIFIIHKRLNR